MPAAPPMTISEKQRHEQKGGTDREVERPEHLHMRLHRSVLPGADATSVVLIAFRDPTFRARRDVVDVFVGLLVAPVLVVLVEAADRALLDRALRAAIAVLARRLALVLRRRVRPEVAAARAATARRRRRQPGAAPSRSAAGAKPPELPPGPPGRGAAEAARARRAGGPLLARPRLADRERPPFERLLIEPADRRFGDRAIRVVDEREAARAAGFPIDGKNNLGGFADARQMLP